MIRTRAENASYPILRRAALATGGVFVLSGVVQATWVSRLPEVRARLDAAPGELGFALLGSSIGAVLSTPVTGRLSNRFGSRTVVAVATVTTLLGLLALGMVQSIVELGLALLLFGFGYGSWDVAMNIHGHGVEAAARRPWMPQYHAAWSVGSFAAAGIGAAAAATRVPIPIHFLISAILCLVGVLALLTLFVVDRREAVVIGPTEELHVPVEKVRLLTVTLFLMGVVMACATLIEGAASDWLGIYFDTVRHTAPAAGAAAYTTFAVAMAISRAAGTWSIGWLGRSRTVRLSALVALVGVAVVLESPITALAYAGAFLWGIGTAIVFPAIISAAGDTPGRSAEAIASVAPIGYAGFLVGPPLIGLLAQHLGLGHALWTVGGLAAIMFLLAGVTRERPRQATA